MLQKATLVLGCCLLLCLTGCGLTVDDTTQSAKRVYKSYINVDPKLDLEFEGLGGDDEEFLARQFGPADRRLDAMLRELYAQETLPASPAWLDEFMIRHPFLSGVAVVDLSGRVVRQVPETGLKPFNPGGIFSQQEAAKKRKAVSYFETGSELGAEAYVGQPFFKENDLKGFLVAHFDPRSLAMQAPEPEKLLIFHYGGVLWASDPAAVPSALTKTPWKDVVRSDVDGAVKSEGKRYVWLARSFAGQHIIYAAPVEPRQGSGFRLW